MGKLLPGSEEHRELVVLENRLRECEGALKDAEACAKEASSEVAAARLLVDAKALSAEIRDLRRAMKAIQEDVSER